jgi:hypothetical protein
MLNVGRFIQRSQQIQSDTTIHLFGSHSKHFGPMGHNQFGMSGILNTQTAIEAAIVICYTYKKDKVTPLQACCDPEGG